jgi:CRP-like cAMP-binding protein
MDNDLEQLQKTVTAIHPLPAGDWDAFSAHWKKVSIGRKQTITVAGSKEAYLYFVLEGVQRIFHLDEEGREATLLFTYPPSFGGIIDALLLQQPAAYYYETVTASEVLRLSFAHLLQLMQEHAAINIFVRKALTISVSGLLERLTDLQTCSSEEKFRKLLRRSPHILGLVPQKYLANYLGIDATNFSKLVNTVRI